MSRYLSEIEDIVRSVVNQEIAELQEERDRAIEEMENESRMRDQDWIEAHVHDRIRDYRDRAWAAEAKLVQVYNIVSPIVAEHDTVYHECFQRIQDIVGKDEK